MLATKQLKSLKSIFPPIHHPLPLDKRESQKLLNALTASFRRHLDREHGWATDESPVPSKSAPKLTYLPSNLPTPPPHEHHRPTDRHLRDILANPLFSYDATAPRIFKDPRAVFQEAVSKGLMTLTRAHGFLLATKQEITQSPSLSVQDGLRESGAALLVVQWLRASGMERDLSFIQHSSFTQLLLRMMVAEDLDELASTWLDRLSNSTDTALIPFQKHIPSFIDALVYAKCEKVALEDAYTSLLRSESLLKATSLPPENLLKAWHTLSWKTTVDSWKHSIKDKTLFDEFLAMPEHIGKPASKLNIAHLQLHHPTKPSHNLAVQFLSSDKRWQQLHELRATSAATQKKATSSPRLITKIASLGLDTVQNLLHNDEPKEAQRILKILQDNLSIFAPYRDRRLLAYPGA